MRTIMGTSHFESREKAIEYYLPYYDGDELATSAAVVAKLTAGEIHLGRPEPSRGKILLHIEEGRYYLET